MVRYSIAVVLLACITCVGMLSVRCVAQEPVSGSTGWTLEEARQELQLHPRDSFLQYVALQLARNAGKQEEVAGQIRQWNRPQRGPD